MEGGEPPRRPLTLASSLRMGPLRGGSYILRVAPQKRPHLKTLTLTLTAKEFGLAAHTPDNLITHTTAVTSLHTHEMRRTTHERRRERKQTVRNQRLARATSHGTATALEFLWFPVRRVCIRVAL